MRRGVNTASSPASRRVGWSALVGHTFMHSPHLMQLSTNLRSGSAPGGRMMDACSLLYSGLSLKMGIIIIDDVRLSKRCLLEISISSPRDDFAFSPMLLSVFLLLEGRVSRNEIASYLHDLRHSKHLMHSPSSVLSPSLYIALILQSLSHRRQLTHCSGSTTLLKRLNREVRESAAPRGQRDWHQNLLAKRESAITNRNIINTVRWP